MLRFLSNTAIIHCSRQVAGFGLIEMRGTPGNESPRHVHRVETEGFFVLNGTLRLYIGDRTLRLSEGQSTVAEPGVPHTMVVESGNPARWLVITNGEFDRFVATVASDDGNTRRADPETLKDLAARFGIDIIHPIPATATHRNQYQMSAASGGQARDTSDMTSPPASHGCSHASIPPASLG
jgi:quercetin dioxygenase-like cupin family protein